MTIFDTYPELRESTAMNSLSVMMPANPVKPIAPRIHNRQQRKDVAADSTTPAAATLPKTASKRKIAFHPSLGYAIPPPIPPKVARRNARERNRVKQVNNGFDVLRSHIPTAAKHKKMSKVDTLRHAVDYIRNLKKMLKEQDLSSGIKTETDDDDREDDFDFDDEDDDDDNSQQSFHNDSATSSPMSTAATTTTTTASKAGLTFLQHPLPPRLHPAGYPLTPRTPDSTSTSEFLLNNVPPSLVPPPMNGHVHETSGYDSVHYYGHQPSVLLSPDSSHYSHHSHTPQQPHPLLLAPAFQTTGQPSPVNSVETSPSVFSDSSSFFSGGCAPAPPVVAPSFYYTDCMDPNSEEDELLDAIVKWQED
jgi:achaete-scute complex protein